MNRSTINELMILAQQGTNTAYETGRIFGMIFMIVLGLALLKKIFSGK